MKWVILIEKLGFTCLQRFSFECDCDAASVGNGFVYLIVYVPLSKPFQHELLRVVSM